MNTNNNKEADEMQAVVTEDIDLDNNLLLDEEDKGNGVDDLDDELLIWKAAILDSKSQIHI